MILSGHQPVYLPGIILFNKIALSDAFMYVGHVQMSPKSWQQRNRIGLNGRELMLSVPVGGDFGQSIDETPILENGWRRKHLGSIRQAYQKRPFYGRYFPRLEELLQSRFPSLGDLNRALIDQICDWLAITTPRFDSRDLYDAQGQPRIRGHKTDMLIEMAQAVGADGYLSNEGSRTYVDEAEMVRQGVDHHWQIFEHPVYPQGSGDFLPNLSVIDLLFNLGPDAAAPVRTAGWIADGPARAAAEEGSALP